MYPQQESSAIRSVDAERRVLAMRDEPKSRFAKRVRLERASGE
jgi:hypothetical protein